ncbi:HD domain-containing protein [Pseudomonas sp. MG-9]|uniref:HD domain-containing protein n=1 Tax=Pseudomonas sp. MG-9 TaxID=2839032 RepID=UPI001C0087DA|nr:HD domain-containing protein [Pseudomonas sp. MG-9]MBT9268279.1 HD domain-containing protein [Pseudomonas sp. MG-9]
MTQTLERAIALAATAHAGQVDKGGAPYILHPLKVMLRMSTLQERIVAVLHDVVEDCGISLDDLRKEGFSEEVLTALESVTKVPGESYEDFVERAAQNPIGRVVKLADLEENSDLSRIASPSWEDLERVEKYRRAIGRLRA